MNNQPTPVKPEYNHCPQKAHTYSISKIWNTSCIGIGKHVPIRAAMLATPATAVPMPTAPVPSLAYSGKISFSLINGLSMVGNTLTVDNDVQDQFETGATSVSETGTVVGALMGSYEYTGVLQPDGTSILADYTLGIAGPGLLAQLEVSPLAIINKNAALLSEIPLKALIASYGNFSANYSLQKSIIPIPVATTLPLLALGAALIGVNSARRRRVAAV